MRSVPICSFYPFFGGGIVLIYNLPTLTSANYQLILDRPTIARIFNGSITMWNDPAIRATNPTVTLPSAQITVVIRQDSSGTTNTFLDALNKFSPTVGLPVSNSFPSRYLNNSIMRNFVASPQTGGVIASTTLIENSISYSALAYLQDITLPYAAIINKAGNVISAATPDSTAIPFDGAVFDSRFVTSVTDDADPTSYPIVAVTYVMLLTNVTSNCAHRREALRFLRWGLTDPSPQKRIANLGYVALTPKVQSLVLQALLNITCGGVSLLSTSIVDQHQNGAYIAMMVLTGLFGAIACFLFIVAFTRKGQVVSERVFLALMFAGGMLAYAAVVMWYLVPSNFSICQARQWLTFGSIAFMLCAIFSRLFQIHQIWLSYMVRVKGLSNTALHVYYFVSFGAFVLAQVIILIVWSAVDPFSSIQVTVSQVDVTAGYQCSSNNIWIWAGLEIGFYALLLIWGVYLLYATWDIKQEVGESRWLLIAVYNVIIVTAIAIPLAVAIPGEDNWGLVGGWCTFAIVTSTLSLVLLPRALDVFFAKKKGEDDVPSLSKGRDTQSAEGGSKEDMPDEIKELIAVARRLQNQKRVAAQVEQEENERRAAREGRRIRNAVDDGAALEAVGGTSANESSDNPTSGREGGEIEL
jgi:phosphate transport system substrate-binding protein